MMQDSRAGGKLNPDYVVESVVVYTPYHGTSTVQVLQGRYINLSLKDRHLSAKAGLYVSRTCQICTRHGITGWPRPIAKLR